MEWKDDLYRKISPFIAPNAIIASIPRAFRSTAWPKACRRACAEFLRHPLLQPAALHASG